MSFRNNLIRRGKQLISLNDTGSLNQKIHFSGDIGRVDHKENTKTWGSKYKMTYVRPYIYKQANIPNFQLCYPWERLARFAHSPIIIIITNRILSKGPPKQAPIAILGKPCLDMVTLDTASAAKSNKNNKNSYGFVCPHMQAGIWNIKQLASIQQTQNNLFSPKTAHYCS